MRKLIFSGAAVVCALSLAGAAVAANTDAGTAKAGTEQTANTSSSGASASSTAASGPYAGVKQDQNGMWLTKDGEPTYHVAKNGTVGWYTFDGYLQYSANCMQCHGPDGLGSSYAPNLTQAFKNLTYAQFVSTVAGGKRAVNVSQDLVMPAFGLNKNVMCYINPIYTYLRARSEGAVGRGRPQKHEPVTPGFNKQVDDCMG